MVTIRRVETRDLPALLDIYNHYVLQTPVNFDIEPRTLEQRREWLAQFSDSGKYQCFVAEDRNAMAAPVRAHRGHRPHRPVRPSHAEWRSGPVPKSLGLKVVRPEGLEPPRVTPTDPKSVASTNSATAA